MKIIFKTLYYALLTVLLLIALLLLVPILPIPGNYQVKVVLSGSMEPAIKTGSVVFVTPSNQYQIGDVIMFVNTGFRDSNGAVIPVTHRIIEIKEEGKSLSYTTKGDANDSPDQDLVPKKDVVGKVVFTIPWIGYAVEIARRPYGLLILIVIPSLFIVVDQIRRIRSEILRIKKEKENTAM